jgi:perosamine synthetase
MISQYTPLYNNGEAEALKELVESGSWLSDFKKTEEFENEIAKVTNNKHCIVVNNGTIAISLALYASGVRRGDRVIVPNLTMIATATAVQFIGAIPIFCDIEATTLCLDYKKAIDLAEQHNAKSIIYVTLNGRINTEAICLLKEYCKIKNIFLLKDDAQSLGSITTGASEYDSRIYTLQDNMFADAHTLSFSPHKLVACGQGGAIVTDNDELAETLHRLKDFGRLSGGGDIHDYFGINSKFTEMQAVVGLCQLKNISDRISKKYEIYDEYYQYLNEYMFEPNTLPWFVDLYVEQRENLIEYLKHNNIQTRAMYPMLTSQLIYAESKDYEVAEYYSKRGLWLPSSLNITNEQIKYIAEKIWRFYK